MTLGEIIKEYTQDHSTSQFIKDSGLSKAYVYMLINNKNNKGDPIVPSIETIQKVAIGMHSTFDEVFDKLDWDFAVRINNEIVKNDINNKCDWIIEEDPGKNNSKTIIESSRPIRPIRSHQIYAYIEYVVDGMIKNGLDDNKIYNLLDAIKDSKPEDIEMATDLLKRLKKTSKLE